jgi:hypothetical protein
LLRFSAKLYKNPQVQQAASSLAENRITVSFAPPPTARAMRGKGNTFLRASNIMTDKKNIEALRNQLHLSTRSFCEIIGIDLASYVLMGGDNIELLASDKVTAGSDTTLGVSFLLSPHNFHDLIPAITLFREIKGIDYFQVKPIVISHAERIREGMIFWNKMLFELLGTIKNYETASFKVFSLSYKFADMLLQEESGLPFKRCYGHPFYPTIAADGSVLVCCHMLNNLLDNNNTGVYGRITEEVRFIDIWKSESRWKKGNGIQIGSCPCNCKLSETNKLLENIYGQKEVMHRNFLN